MNHEDDATVGDVLSDDETADESRSGPGPYDRIDRTTKMMMRPVGEMVSLGRRETTDESDTDDDEPFASPPPSRRPLLLAMKVVSGARRVSLAAAPVPLPALVPARDVLFGCARCSACVVFSLLCGPPESKRARRCRRRGSSR